jgi:hypothetical protein
MEEVRPQRDSWRELVHISDREYTVTSRPLESPLCSICRQMLDILPINGLKSVTTDSKIEDRARDGCYLCSLFLYRLRHPLYCEYIKRKEGKTYVDRYQDFPLGDITIELSRYDEDWTRRVQQSDGPLFWSQQYTGVQGVICNGWQTLCSRQITQTDKPQVTH